MTDISVALGINPQSTAKPALQNRFSLVGSSAATGAVLRHKDSGRIFFDPAMRVDPANVDSQAMINFSKHNPDFMFAFMVDGEYNDSGVELTQAAKDLSGVFSAAEHKNNLRDLFTAIDRTFRVKRSDNIGPGKPEPWWPESGVVAAIADVKAQIATINPSDTKAQTIDKLLTAVEAATRTFVSTGFDATHELANSIESLDKNDPILHMSTALLKAKAYDARGTLYFLDINSDTTSGLTVDNNKLKEWDTAAVAEMDSALRHAEQYGWQGIHPLYESLSARRSIIAQRLNNSPQ